MRRESDTELLKVPATGNEREKEQAQEELQDREHAAMCNEIGGSRNGRLSSRLLRSSSRLLRLSYPSIRAR